VHTANKYAVDIIEGNIPSGYLTKLTVKRYFRDLEREQEDDFPYYHDEEAAQGFISFCSACCHFEGRMKGKPFILDPWQQFLAWNIFGWKKKADHKRRFTTAYVEVAKKNGKSLLSSAVQLYMLSPLEGKIEHRFTQ